MTAHPIDTEALREHLRRLIDASAGPGNPTVSIDDLRALLAAIAAAEHRATRAEALSAIRKKQVAYWRAETQKTRDRLRALSTEL